MMSFTGTLVGGKAYNIGDKTKKAMISFSVADEIGNKYSCQMWQDDPQFARFAEIIEQVRYQSVVFMVKSISNRKDNKDAEKLRLNFIASNISFPNQPKAFPVQEEHEQSA